MRGVIHHKQPIGQVFFFFFLRELYTKDHFFGTLQKSCKPVVPMLKISRPQTNSVTVCATCFCFFFLF